MFKRHFIALAITLLIYYLPTMGYYVPDKFLWFHNALLSSIYIALIYRFAKIRLMPLLVLTETIAVFTTLAACYQLDVTQSKGFFYSNYEQIINACYMAELIIIGIGAVSGGVYKSIYRLWLSLFGRDTRDHRLMVSWEKLV